MSGHSTTEDDLGSSKEGAPEEENWGLLSLSMERLDAVLETHRQKWRDYRERNPRHMRQVEGTVMKLSF